MKNSTDDIKALREQVDAVFVATKSTRDEMRRHRALYEGKLWDSGEPEFQGYDKSSIQHNMCFETVEAVAPLITDNRPIARVNPKYPFLSRLGEVLNNVTKYAWQAMDMQMKLHQCVVDAKTCKMAVVKMGYCPTQRFGSKYTMDVIDPIDFFIAPGYGDVWEAPWCGVRAPKPISWIRDAFPDVKLRATKEVTDDDERAFKFTGASPHETDQSFVVVTEMWVRDDETMEELVEETEDGKKRKVRKQKFPYGKFVWFTDRQKLGEEAQRDNHGLPPYAILRNYVRPHDVTGISDVELIEGLHKDQNWILKTISEYIRRYHNQNELADSTSGFDVDTYKENRSKGGQVFSWDSRGGNLKPPVEPIDQPQLSQDMKLFLTAIPGIVESVTGVTDVTKGQVGKQERQSASELAILSETSNTRTRQQIRNLEAFLSRVFYLFLRNVMQHQSEPEYFSWSEPDGRGYQMYGNSRAQAEEVMRPQRNERMEGLLERAQTSSYVIAEEDRKAMEEYQQDFADYEKFLQLFKEEGDLDPIFFPFTIEIQADSMLPMDKQSRANILLRLLQMAPQPAQPAMFELVLEYLQIPNADKVIAAMQQMIGQMQKKKRPMSPQDQAAAAANPEAFEQYQQEVQGG